MELKWITGLILLSQKPFACDPKKPCFLKQSTFWALHLSACNNRVECAKWKYQCELLPIFAYNVNSSILQNLQKFNFSCYTCPHWEHLQFWNAIDVKFQFVAQRGQRIAERHTWRTKIPISEEGLDAPSTLHSERRSGTRGGMSVIKLIGWRRTLPTATVQSTVSLERWIAIFGRSPIHFFCFIVSFGC